MDVAESVIGQTNKVKDELGEKCQKLFKDFLNEFTEDIESGKGKYAEEALNLVKPERNTLFVSFEDIQKFDQNLSTLLVEEFYRLYPFLCKALASYVKDELLKSRDEANSNMVLSVLKNKNFFVGLYNVPTQMKIRELKASKIGTLRRITGRISTFYFFNEPFILIIFNNISLLY